LATIRRSYGERCDAMLQAMERELPEGARWTRPDGGLFLWLELPPRITDRALFRRAIARSVAVVPRSAFFVSKGPGRDRFLRLNFSKQTIPRIREGVRRLSAALNPVDESMTVTVATG